MFKPRNESRRKTPNRCANFPTVTGFVFAGVLTIVFALVLLLNREKSGTKALDVTVINYERHPDIIGAVTIWKMPVGRQLGVGDIGLPPMLRVMVETSEGWTNQDAGDMSPVTVRRNFRPGATNVLTIALPSDTLRWRVIFSGREASLREKFGDKLIYGGAWARDGTGKIRPFLRWVLLRLPNNSGRNLQFESEVFDTHEALPKRHQGKSLQRLLHRF